MRRCFSIIQKNISQRIHMTPDLLPFQHQFIFIDTLEQDGGSQEILFLAVEEILSLQTRVVNTFGVFVELFICFETFEKLEL